MLNITKSICWSMLFLALLLPLALRVLRWIWLKISIYKRFQPDFLTPFRTLFFKSFRDNISYNAPGENFSILIVVIFTFGFCCTVTKFFFRTFPELADHPYIVTVFIGIFGFAIALFGFLSFLKESKPKKEIADKTPGLDKRSIILFTLIVLIIFILVLAFIYAKFF